MALFYLSILTVYYQIMHSLPGLSHLTLTLTSTNTDTVYQNTTPGLAHHGGEGSITHVY